MKNGGLYGGPAVDRAWIPKPVYPTSSYFTNYLLEEANPPPGAVEQAIGINRPENSYTAAPLLTGIKKHHVKMKDLLELKELKRKINEGLKFYFILFIIIIK